MIPKLATFLKSNLAICCKDFVFWCCFVLFSIFQGHPDRRSFKIFTGRATMFLRNLQKKEIQTNHCGSAFMSPLCSEVVLIIRHCPWKLLLLRNRTFKKLTKKRWSLCSRVASFEENEVNPRVLFWLSQVWVADMDKLVKTSWRKGRSMFFPLLASTICLTICYNLIVSSRSKAMCLCVQTTGFEAAYVAHSSVLPGESQGWGTLVGCRLWGCTESDTTEAT